MQNERACANTPALSRRMALAGLAASPFVGVTATHAAPASHDPIIPLYNEWLQRRAEWEEITELPEHKDANTPEVFAIEYREESAYDAMLDLTPSSLEGLAAVVHVTWHYRASPISKSHPRYMEECNYPSNKGLRAIYRFATGQDLAFEEFPA